MLEGAETGLATARAGNLCEDISGAFLAVLKKYGIVKDNRAGHAIGLSYPPDRGERTMSLRAGDRSELKRKLTFHFMAGLWQDDWSLEITESMVIGETGAEPLSNYPRPLLVKDGERGARRDARQPDYRVRRLRRRRHPARPPQAAHCHDGSARGAIMIPVTVIKNGENPTALLTGANHGGDYEGPVALSVPTRPRRTATGCQAVEMPRLFRYGRCV